MRKGFFLYPHEFLGLPKRMCSFAFVFVFVFVLCSVRSLLLFFIFLLLLLLLLMVLLFCLELHGIFVSFAGSELLEVRFFGPSMTDGHSLD